ncbi:CYFA0S01e03862g1_1 [Cyberlindnera fabianii]|uniref:CYFA0S01e03862g1_1 n=1 Tax=Cyberlindnera fabianii TaxID=36022 RepID=A0A061AMY8_CYBFA|nr:CYFA0S01e03862g1_1 [Cyberlindnera fabianii]
MSKAFKRSIKNVVSGYTSAQVKVRNATSNEPYGPSQGEMEDLVELTYEHTEFLDIMDIIDKRLNDKGKNWRHVAKALTVLDYLVRCGSENCVRWSRDNLYIIKTLREFQYVDEEGHDQGSVIRVKAKELTSLLRDDERLRMERDLRASRRNGRHRTREDFNNDDETEEERALREALEESKRTAEEDERKRRAANGEDDGLEAALRLSREEEEARRLREQQNGNLLDLNDTPQVQYDIWGNPIYPGQQDAYQLQLQQQQQAALLAQQQQQAQQAYMLQNQALMEQQQQEYLQQQYLQQQYMQQQQYLQEQQYLAQQQALQQQQMLQTGSNNPFAMGSGSSPEQQPAQTQTPSSQPKTEPVQQPLKKIPTGSQQKNQQFSELNQLLAQGTGIDTFGNEGATRIPAQYTKTSQFLNSSGTGIGQTQHSIGNPFLKQQYTGVASTGIVPAQTGYGFGNQAPASQSASSRGNDQSLIDI